MTTLDTLVLQTWNTLSHEGILVADPDGNIRLINPRLMNMLEIGNNPKTLAQLLTYTKHYAPDLCEVLEQEFQGAATRKHGKLKVERTEQRWLNWEQTPLYENNSFSGMVTIFRAAKEDDQLGAARYSFLSMISHDLRTPLSAIIGFAELLNYNIGNVSQEELTEFVGHILRNANDLNRYAEVALDIAFLEANPDDFDVESINLNAFLKNWLTDARYKHPPERFTMDNNNLHKEFLTYGSPSALHKALHILLEFALAESLEEDTIHIRLAEVGTRAHIYMQHHAPNLSEEEANRLFDSIPTRDLSERGRPRLHRMKLHVANLLMERQKGMLTLHSHGENQYQLDLMLPLAAS